MNKTPALITVLLATVVTGITGCSTPTPAPQVTVTAPAPTQPAPAQPTPAQPEPAAPAPAEGAPLAGTTTFPNGLQATITGASQAATEYAYNAIDGRIVVITLTLTNTTTEPIDAFLSSLPSVSTGTTGTTAQAAVDTTITLDTIGILLPGETRTVNSGWGIPAANYSTVRVEVMGPTITDTPAVFKGSIQ